ncbi:MAG: MAPEG family protein [Xanthomonadales bacterium]|uniref:MAPEG family protein n=1 Tax=Dokdonella sp. TaxID=2291710 RepID=UPI002CDE754C|nr:MAPEG family protein [Xanthomonadales bacterium]HQV72449.1 MAPEG family protein [Dokdonella sp.]MBK7013408.1 MAPEG family protein [Xanthomonadales bacterium]MBK7210961.1 MAPEG family protein [Xanthomonadales bacterium]MBL0222835.1 MAPEG family protein [Xanthomonadales bacterium]
MHITAIYAALSALLIVALSFRVIRLRLSTRTGIGDGGHQDLARRIRAHANAVEYLPLALLLLLLVEWNQTLPLIVHGFGIVLVLGRLLHAVGLSRSAGASPARFIGMLLTLLCLLGMAALLLWQAVVLTSV